MTTAQYTPSTNVWTIEEGVHAYILVDTNVFEGIVLDVTDYVVTIASDDCVRDFDLHNDDVYIYRTEEELNEALNFDASAEATHNFLMDERSLKDMSENPSHYN